MRKFNIVVTALVAAAILFIAVMTIKSAVSDPDAPRVTETPPTATATPPNDDPTPTLDVTEQTEEPPEPTPPPIEGESFTVMAPYARETLTLTVDTELYVHEETEEGALFFAREDDSREVFIEIVFLMGDLEMQKLSFLDNYLSDAEDTQFNGAVNVAASSVASQGISAQSATRSVDAWLVKAEGGFFAVVTGYKTAEQGEYLYRMLNSLVFVD